MKRFLLAAALILGGCSAVEPDWRRVGTGLDDWETPPANWITMVSPVMPHSELSDYVAARRSEGWGVAAVEPAGSEFPSCYLVTFRRPQQ